MNAIYLFDNEPKIYLVLRYNNNYVLSLIVIKSPIHHKPIIIK